MGFWFNRPLYESAYFENVLACCDALQTSDPTGIRTRIEELKELDKIAATCELELLQLRLIGLIGPDGLVQAIPDLRSRWAAMTGQPAKPQAPDPGKPDELLAEANFLAMQIHRHYRLQEIFEQTKRWILNWMTVGLGLIVVGGAVWFSLKPTEHGAFLLGVVAGILGGYTSCLWRVYQAVPGKDLVTANQAILSDGMGVIVKPALGGVFGVVLYLLFMSHMVSGTMFPELKFENFAADASVRFADFFKGTLMAPATEFAKLLIWCFLGGFAERFVPDVLNSLSTRGEKAAAARGK